LESIRSRFQNTKPAVNRFRSLRLIVAAVVLSGAAVAGSAQPGPRPGAPPDDFRLTPEQRQQLWRQMTPEEKGRVLRDLTPAQREALRERMIEERRRRFDDDARGPHRLSPEERQRLRDQIYESNRDFREQFHDRRGDRGDERRDDRRDDRRGRGGRR
jgi:hypothetical protein